MLSLKNKPSNRRRHVANRRLQVQTLETRRLLHGSPLGDLHGGGDHGLVIDGNQDNQLLASAFRSAGDVNGDQLEDYLVSAPGAFDNTGEAYLFFGTPQGIPANTNPELLNGTTGFHIDGEAAGDQASYSIAALGDVNGDSYDDVAIGAPFTDHGGNDAGSVYVIFGGPNFADVVPLDSLDGTNGFRLDGAFAGQHAGFSVAGAGDVNGDDLNDLVIGSPEAMANGDLTGVSYVWFGAQAAPSAVVGLNTLNGTTGFRIVGEAGSQTGYSVATAGDVNADGLSDIVLGAPQAGGEIGDACSTENSVGLLVCDEAAAPGYTLFAPSGSQETFLIDNDGFVINTWNSENRPSLSAYLLEDGSLLRTGTGGVVEIQDWEGNQTWFYDEPSGDYRLHHDIERLPNGNILMIAWQTVSEADAIAQGRDPSLLAEGELWPESIIEVQATGPNTGDIVWEWHVMDHLVQDFDSSLPNYGVVEENPQLIDLNFTLNPNGDWLHFNGIDYNPDLDQIAISVHHFSEVWIIDHSTTTAEAAGHSGGNSGKGGDLLYRWGNPRTYGAGTQADQQLWVQHDARWIEPGYPGAGNITVFNNGLRRPGGNASSFEEFTPPLDASNGNNYEYTAGTAYGPEAPVFTYPEQLDPNFFAPIISGAHRLANGNTLLTDGPAGEFREIDSDGNIVWQYINPVGNSGIFDQGETPEMNSVFRATKYDPSYPAFAGRDLTPQDRIEAGSEATIAGPGGAFVIFGQDEPFAARLNVADLDGQNGFRVDGVAAGDQAGQSVGGGGDFNHDGFDDVVVGSPRAVIDGRAIGAAYVVYGSDSPGTLVDLDSIDGESVTRLGGDYGSDPMLNSLVFNTGGLTGFDGHVVNFTSAIPDAESIFLHTSGIPHYTTGIGPWPGQNRPTDTDLDIQLPRNPQEQIGNKTETRLGAIGVLVDGVAIYNWSDARSFNDEGNWNQLAIVFEDFTFDECDAHAAPNSQYHVHGAPGCLMDYLDDDGSVHSPIIGWAYDGFPVYGPYGYSNADGTGEIQLMQSGWELRNITERTELPDGTLADGPSLAEVALGSYKEDFEFVGSGDLDAYNGRFAVTPEFPEGIYHYHATMEADRTPVFPYLIGVEYFGVVEENNIGRNRMLDPIAPTNIAVDIVDDISGDGIADVLVGDPDSGPSTNVAGAAYAVYGGVDTPADFNLHSVDGVTGQRYYGASHGDQVGASVGAADVNNDGTKDFLIGAPNADLELLDILTGRGYVVFGTPVNTDVPHVVDVAVNGSQTDPSDRPDGPQPTSWQSQGSDIQSVEVTFSEPLQPTLDDVRLINLGVDAPNELDIEILLEPRHLVLNGNQLSLRFEPFELPDGIYQLELLPTLQNSDGDALDGDGDGVAGGTYRFEGTADNPFYKLTADFNGDGGVSIFDWTTFAYWFGATDAPAYVDLDRDGGVGIFDFSHFAVNFGISLEYRQQARRGLLEQTENTVLATDDTTLLPEVADDAVVAVEPILDELAWDWHVAGAAKRDEIFRSES